jgi:hypothetical protein
MHLWSMRFAFVGPSGLFALAGQLGQRIGKLISPNRIPAKENGSELPQGQL